MGHDPAKVSEWDLPYRLAVYCLCLRRMLAGEVAPDATKIMDLEFC